MRQQHNSAARQAAGLPAKTTQGPVHRLRRLGIIILVVVALLGLLFSYAPRYLARYLVSSQLDDLGIDYEGVDTLSINPWTRVLWLGPVRFGAGPSDRGQLGELGLTIRVNPLLKRRVSIERLLMSGIDLVVTRGKDKALALNGIPLSQFMPPREAAVQPETAGAAWGAGVDTIELRESRLVFQDRDRGDLEVDVERLTLMAFETWEPDRPGRFELAARVNDVQLNWSGEARPFADNVTLAIDSRTEHADFPKLARFTGPAWGLNRREGTYDADLKHEVTLFASGGLEGHTLGSIDIQGADYERAGMFALTLERAKVDLDVRYSLSDSGDFALQGQVATDLGRGTGALGEDTRFAVAAGRVAVSELDTAYVRDGTLRLEARPEIDLESVEFSGPIEISTGKLLELLALLQSLSAGAAVSTADTGLADIADTAVTLPTSDVTVGRLRSRGESFSLRSNEGWVELDLKTDSDLFDIHIGVKERNIGIERLQSLLERLSLKSGRGRLTLDMAGSNSLVAGSSVSPIGELKVGAFESNMKRLGLQVQTGAVSLQLAAASQVNGVSVLLFPQGARPEMQLHLGAASAALSEVSLDTQGGALRWQAKGGAAVDSLTADFAKGKEGAFKLVRAEIEALDADERLLAADALTVDGLDLYVKRSLLAALGRGEDAGGEQAVSSGDAAAQPGVAAPTPALAAQEVDVTRVQALLTELGYSPGPVDGRMGRRTAAAISDFQRREGLPVDGRPTSGLLAALESRAAGTADGDAAPAPRTGVPGRTGPAVRLGRFALTGNPVLRFRDDLVTPQVKVDSVFKELEVRNLNTQKATQRTDLSLIADVNEFTHVELKGWVAGFGETADLDVIAKVDNLELSNYSPYVSALGGVHLESGQLDKVTTAKAERGALQGQIQLELDDVAFRPLSKEDAERMSATIGVPLETAVNLLQDSEGRIVLTLPIGGELRKPKVDVSSAVDKAIGGALKKVFPPAVVASMLAGIAKGTGPTFEPIEFSPGSAELGEAGKRYADGVAKLLTEHPKLSLKVCGRSTAQDMEHVTIEAGESPTAGGKGETGRSSAEPGQDSAQAEQALAELAVERKRAVRRYLIQEKGADAKRVPECRSTFQGADQGSPRVEISL